MNRLRHSHTPWRPVNSAGEDLPDWTRDATLGIFVHWGPYSVPAWAEPSGELGDVPDRRWYSHNAYAEWYANTIRIDGSSAAAHHAAQYNGRPYEAFLDQWHAAEYDPTEWARLFRDIGADYVIPTTKHHDGVALWDAPGSQLRNSVARGPRRDLIAPLATAVREQGMRFGVYYSGGLDWAVTHNPPHRSTSDLETLRPKDACYNEYAHRQVLDLIERYSPDVLWNDIDWPDAGKAPGPRSLDMLFAAYREAVPEGVVNDRWGIDRWDFRTTEYSVESDNDLLPGWEHCRGLGLSFGFNRNEDTAVSLTPRELTKLYSDIVSRGGRLLLNVGPTASGRIPPIQRRTLEGTASWLQAVKPHTRERGPVDGHKLQVEGAEWWRAWSTAGRTVVVVDNPRANVRTADDSATIVVPLPEPAESP